MFVPALFIITKDWKQPRCPSAGDWVNCGGTENGVFFKIKKK